MGWGRAYFAAQAVLGAAWWVAVFTVPSVDIRYIVGLLFSALLLKFMPQK